MEGNAFCHGAATIINGIALGKGAAFGIGLKTSAKVKLTDEPDVFKVTIEGDESEDQSLAICCVKEVLKKFGKESDYGAKIRTSSNIPISRGLKSSSAAANAIVLAIYNALGEEYSDMEVINLGIDAALTAKVSITGAFDDACAAYFGNVVVTDNIKREILRQYSIRERCEVIIHVPKEKIKKTEVDIDRLTGIKDEIKIAHDLALNKNYIEALRINGLTYGIAMGLNTEIATKALAAGAITAGISGTGPATVILVEPNKKDDIISVLGDKNKIICTTINSDKAGLE